MLKSTGSLEAFRYWGRKSLSLFHIINIRKHFIVLYTRELLLQNKTFNILLYKTC